MTFCTSRTSLAFRGPLLTRFDHLPLSHLARSCLTARSAWFVRYYPGFLRCYLPHYRNTVCLHTALPAFTHLWIPAALRRVAFVTRFTPLHATCCAEDSLLRHFLFALATLRFRSVRRRALPPRVLHLVFYHAPLLVPYSFCFSFATLPHFVCRPLHAYLPLVCVTRFSLWLRSCRVYHRCRASFPRCRHRLPHVTHGSPFTAVDIWTLCVFLLLASFTALPRHRTHVALSAVFVPRLQDHAVHLCTPRTRCVTPASAVCISR